MQMLHGGRHGVQRRNQPTGERLQPPGALAATGGTVDAELAVLRELAAGAYEISSLDAGDLQLCAEVVARYRDQGIGVTDASLAVLARRHRTRTILMSRLERIVSDPAWSANNDQ